MTRKPVEANGEPIPDDRPLDQTTAILHTEEHSPVLEAVTLLAFALVFFPLLAISFGIVRV